MTEGKRIAVLKDTLKRVAYFATLLEPTGISLRSLNYTNDGSGDFDNLKKVDEIMRRVDRVKFSGGMKLGTVLNSKIVQPLVIQKANNDKFKRLLIAVIITDREVSLCTFNSSKS